MLRFFLLTPNINTKRQVLRYPTCVWGVYDLYRTTCETDLNYIVSRFHKHVPGIWWVVNSSLCDRRVILQLNYDGWVWQESEGRDGLGQGSRLGEMGKVWTRSETITEDQRRESVGENLSLLPACYGQCTSQKSLPVIRRGGSVGGMWRRFCAGVLDMTTSRHPWVKLQKTLWRLARDFDYFNRRVGSGDMVSTT